MLKKMGRGENKNSSEGLTFLILIRGIILSYIITIPVFAIFSVILTYTDYPNRLIKPVVVVTTVISILIAGISITKNAKSKGWLNGGLVGFVYMLILYILSSIVFKEYTINRYVLTMTAIGILTGCIGGILGINMRGRSKPRMRQRNI